MKQVGKPLVHRIVQIAGIRDRAEAELVLQCGVRWLGFPLRLAVHQPDLTEAAAAEIIHTLPADAVPVLITYLEQAKAVVELARYLGIRAVQLHGEITMAELAELRRIAPELLLIKSLIVGREPQDELIRQMKVLSPLADVFITDSFDPSSGACGATGRVHDWDISRRLTALSPRPVILAGGLTSENVAAAIRAVKPAGIDAHTGVENPDGGKDPGKIRSLMVAAQAAFDTAGVGVPGSCEYIN